MVVERWTVRTLLSIEGDVYSYRDLNDLLLKKISLAVVEGDYALSVNNCRADAIKAAQAVVENGWVARGGEEGRTSGTAARLDHRVGRRAAEAV